MFFLFFLFFYFFIFFSGRSHPVLAKNIAGKRFYYFLNFFTIFFRNFLSQVEYERNSELKFCFHFFGLSHPVFAKSNAGKRFYNFLNFFTIFFQNFLARVEYERNSELKFCFLFFNFFLADLIPFWLKILLGRGFIIFWIFLLFFFEIFLPGSSMNGIQN